MEENIQTRHPEESKQGVNLDLEARGEIERIPRSSPQRLRLKETQA